MVKSLLLPAAAIFAAVSLVINLSWTLHGLYDGVPALGLRLLWPVDKSNLSIVRFLNFLALAYLVGRFIPRDAAFFAKLPAPFCGSMRPAVA